MFDYKKFKLLKTQRSVNSDDDDVLHMATYANELRVIKILIGENNYNYNRKNKFGWTPLHIACMRKHTDIIDYLLSLKNIDVNVLTNDGKSPVQLSTIKDDSLSISHIMMHKKFVRSPDDVKCAMKHNKVEFDPCYQRFVKEFYETKKVSSISTKPSNMV